MKNEDIKLDAYTFTARGMNWMAEYFSKIIVAFRKAYLMKL
jgi:hypothetical protein